MILAMLRVLMLAVFLSAADAFVVPTSLLPKSSSFSQTKGSRAAACSLRTGGWRQGVCMMADGTFDRLGRIAKDKLSGAKDWVEETADSAGNNVRGMGAGALAGGLLLGPLGAVLGGYLGRGIGSGSAADREAAKRLGLTPEVMKMMAELDSDLSASRADYELVKQARDGLIKRKEQLTQDAEEYYARAKDNLVKGNEAGARTALTYRQECLDKLEPMEKQIDDANFRCQQFKRSMSVMEDRLQDILNLQARSASASVTKRELEEFQDPLLEKFRKWENEDR